MFEIREVVWEADAVAVTGPQKRPTFVKLTVVPDWQAATCATPSSIVGLDWEAEGLIGVIIAAIGVSVSERCAAMFTVPHQGGEADADVIFKWAGVVTEVFSAAVTGVVTDAWAVIIIKVFWYADVGVVA